MAGLGETTARLARMRKAMQADQQAFAGDDAGMSEVRGFGFNPGALRMLAYAPENLPAGAPLVVVLHGCTQHAGPHARAAGWLALADRLGFAVLAPEQVTANNFNRCFNWYQPDDAVFGGGEAASINAMVEYMVRIHQLDAGRVFVTGLSAGGAMTAVLLAAYPDTFSAGAIVAGLPYGLAGNVQEALSMMRNGTRLSGADLGALVSRAAPAKGRTPRLAIWHGDADHTVTSGNADAIARQWAAVHGLPEQPTEVASRSGWTRSVWRGPDGEAVIEFNMLAGVGHGTPLAAGGADPIGEVSAYMLETGVSSSLEIARFWGLAPTELWPEADLVMTSAERASGRRPAARERHRRRHHGQRLPPRHRRHPGRHRQGPDLGRPDALRVTPILSPGWGSARGGADERTPEPTPRSPK